MMVSMNKLLPGMKVLRDVRSVNGTVLLAAGTEIAAQHIRVLKMWGVDGVAVRGEEDTEARHSEVKVVDPEMLRAAQDQVDQRLRHAIGSHPAVALVRELAIRRTAAELAANSTKRASPTP